jgi:hypothetical protein
MDVRLALVVGTILISLSALPPLLAEEGAVDITNYEMDLTLQPESRSMDATVVLEFTSLVDGLETVVFSLNDDMVLRDVKDGSGGSLEFDRGDDNVRVFLKTPMESNQRSLLRFEYSFTSPPSEKDKFIWGYVGSEVSYLIYEYLWYPMVWGDRATASITISVPTGLTAVSIGDFKGKTSGGDTDTFRWEAKSPTRGVSMVAARYMEKTILIYPHDDTKGDDVYETGRVIRWSGSGQGEPAEVQRGHRQLIPVTCYLFPQDFYESDGLLESTSEILDIFSNKFGGYPYKEFRVVEMPDFFFGGHGDQGFIMLHSMAIRQNSDEFLAHEIAHNWWGSLVFAEGQPSLKSIGGYKMFTPKDSNLDYLGQGHNQNLWLHEGFATYSGVLYVEGQYGKEGMLDSLDYKKDEYLNMRIKYGDVPISEMQEEYSRGLYHAIVYSKGAYVLHMLRYVVGDEAFFEIMNTYLEEYKERSATIEDFQRVSEEVSGMDLDWFFEEWIYEARLPDFVIKDVQVTQSREGYSVEVEISQAGDAVYMPIDVTLHTAAGEVTKRVWVLGDTKRVNFLTQAKPEYIGLDEDRWLLESNVKNNVYTLGFAPGFLGLGSLDSTQIAIFALAAVMVSALLLLVKSLRPSARESYI